MNNFLQNLSSEKYEKVVPMIPIAITLVAAAYAVFSFDGWAAATAVLCAVLAIRAARKVKGSGKYNRLAQICRLFVVFITAACILESAHWLVCLVLMFALFICGVWEAFFLRRESKS